jgi:hypothetical protein
MFGIIAGVSPLMVEDDGSVGVPHLEVSNYNLGIWQHSLDRHINLPEVSWSEF